MFYHPEVLEHTHYQCGACTLTFTHLLHSAMQASAMVVSYLGEEGGHRFNTHLRLTGQVNNDNQKQTHKITEVGLKGVTAR